MREERGRLGFSQATLAERVTALLDYKVDGSSVTRIEKGERSVRLAEALAIAEALRIPLAALLRDRAAIDDEIGELERDLSEELHRASLAEEALQRARTSARAIERRIAELEAIRRG
jgi:transcriptional regulator with XRE-family HTH domain